MRNTIPFRNKENRWCRSAVESLKMLRGSPREEDSDKGRRAGSSFPVSVILTSSKSQKYKCSLSRDEKYLLYYTATDLSHSHIIVCYVGEKNMQSVKRRLIDIDFMINNYYLKIAMNSINKNNKRLISNISLIICVPQLVFSTCYNYYYVMDLNNLVYIVLGDRYYNIMTDTKNLGAFPTLWELDESQSICNVTVNHKCDEYNLSIINGILINQITGHGPNDSIPQSKIIAITVQGMKMGGPHPHSFKLMKVMNSVQHSVTNSTPFILNKSDYVFIWNRTLYCESDILSTNIEIREKWEATTRATKKGEKPERLNIKFMRTTPICEENDKSTKFNNGDYTFAALLKIVEDAPAVVSKVVAAGSRLKNWGIPAIMRLAGGGESSLNTPTGWGTPPSSSSNNSNAGNNGNWGNNAPGGPSGNSQQWVSNNQRPPTSQSDGNSNKLNNGSGSSNSNIPPPTSASNNSSANWGTSTQSSQPPQSQAQATNSGGGSPGGGNSGGGSTPGSGAPSTPPQATTTAKSQLEQLNTMRESLFSLDGWGGQHVNQDTNWDVPNSPEPGVKMDQPGGGPPMWKPNVNNGTDLWEANLRNGGQPPPQPVAKTPWGHTPTTNIGGTWGEDDDTPESNNVWNGPPPPQQWGGPPQQPPHWNASSAKKDDWGGWGEPHRPDLHRPDVHRAPAPDPRDMRTLMGDMRGDPRGISGRLNGSTDMWGQHHMQHTMQPPSKMMSTNVGNGVSQWGAQGPKDMTISKSASGWEEPSPPAARRNMSNFDDGTSLWGQQRGGSVGMGPWKDMGGGMGRGTMPCPPGLPPNRLPGVAPNSMKPDSMWGQPPHRNGSWEDQSGHNAANWEKESVNSWNENPMNPSASGWPGAKAKPLSGPGGSWDSDMGDWCGPKPPVGGPPAKLLPKDVVWNSKQFRFLADMGYKKEDVEQALRSRDMNADEALDLLSQMRSNGGMDTWRRHEEHPGGPPFDHQQQQYPTAPPRPHHSFPPQQPPSSALPFTQPSSINNMSPAMVQKMINPSTQPQPPFNQQSGQSGGGGQPTATQLRMLVQQIQMAVSAGYLNHQILNQPLAPQTLLLLNQLLQQIKHLQKQASQQAMMQNTMAVGKNNSAFLQLSYQISKTKQQIASLQNQITAQQTIYVQQQAGGAGGGTGSGTGGPSSGSSSGDFFNKQHDPLSQLQNNFADLTMNKEPPGGYGGGSGQQSRLNQWKLPSLDNKDVEGPEFSRAPGTTSKAATSPQLNPLVLQPDNTWSSGVRGQGVNDGWPSSDTSDLPDGKDGWSASQHSSATTNISDLIPEFEPGKPWKGNQMKSIEDDPAITPGSVARSPLSLATIKEPDSVVGGKVSPSTPSLSSTTWTYPPPPATTPSSLGLPKGDALWGSKPAAAGGRATSSKTSSSSAAGPSAWAAPAPPRNQPYQHQSWPSTWLLLKNLTTQIDGSTLKTLCMQHGPLQSFHLYLNQSIALAKYNTREEANKAQTALNNCVLGNTTIFAESPGESDVKLILQHLGQSGGGGGQWRTSAGTGGSTPGAAGSASDWSFPSLWSEPEQRATPSSLSFLPPDLLGGESM